MARRGRGSSARTKATPGGRDAAVNGSAVDSDLDDPNLPGDEPGARTIGALALKRWAARGPGRGGADDGGDTPRTHGPFDEEDLVDDPAAPVRVDFGAVRVPVPPRGEVSVEPEDGRLQAVHVMLPAGRLSVSALAAPRTERLWPDLAAEIDESLREGGATVRSFTGEWGRELHARTGDASSLFVGVDGPRWMLYGVATGPTSAASELDAALRAMLRGTVVVRGRSPYPVRTVLPLTVPDQLAPPAGTERVPVPRTPAEGVAPRARPAPMADAPTTITTIGRSAGGLGASGTDAAELDAAGIATVPHGFPRPAPAAPVGDDGRRPAYRTPPAAAADEPPPGPGPTPADDPDRDADGAETAVTRTASRGLFRRKPERASGRPPQRRVADLIAQAERDRAEAERAGPSRRGADPAGSAASPPARPAAVERRANGHDADHSRTNGFVPRELSHDQPAHDGGSPDRPVTNGAPVHVAGDGPSPYRRSATNGAGHAHDVPNGYGGRAGASTNGAQPTGPSVDGQPVDGPRIDGPLPGGSVPGGSVPGGPGRGGAYPPSGLAADGSDDWTLPLPVVRPEPRPEPEPEPGYAAGSAAPPRSRRARREAQERAAAQRATSHRAPDRWTPDEWTPGEWTPGDQTRDEWGRNGRGPGEWGSGEWGRGERGPDEWAAPRRAADRWTPDRPRHTRGRHEPSTDEPRPRAERRAAQARHAEEGDDPGGRAVRPRHRRPEG